jgi:hypothetical protein
MSTPTSSGNQNPYGTGQNPYGTGVPSQTNTSAVVLTVLSALSLCNFLTLGSLALGIIALAKSSTDPEGSRRLTRIGWIVFAAVWVLAIVVLSVIAVLISAHSSTVPEYDYRV